MLSFRGGKNNRRTISTGATSTKQVLSSVLLHLMIINMLGGNCLSSYQRRSFHLFVSASNKQFTTSTCNTPFRKRSAFSFLLSSHSQAPTRNLHVNFHQQKSFPFTTQSHRSYQHYVDQPRNCGKLFQYSSSSTVPTSSIQKRDDNETKEEEVVSSSSSSSSHSNYITSKSKQDEFHKLIEKESNSIHYPKGIPEGFYIIQQYNVPDVETFNDMLQNAIRERGNDTDTADSTAAVGITQDELNRLGIKDGQNVTLPIALMLLDPKEYPSFSKARKACRKGYIIIHRGPLDLEQSDKEGATLDREEDVTLEKEKNFIFNREKSIRGRVADRVYPNDVIGRQVRMHGGFYPGLESSQPPFDLPVVYEDDHFAIVNKPAGVVIYAQRNQGHGMMTIRAALPFVLKPPRRGTLAIIRRPVSVHRLDKPTSGLLLVAKTKPAMVDLTKQFVERRIKKTYTAILNGIPDEPTDSSITAEEARKMGVDIDIDADPSMWQLIDSPLDDGNSVKSAVTVWKPLKYSKSLKAKDGIVTLVEMKPKTGRYHQLRRHMAWIRDCPIIGDKEYDGGADAMDLRGRGLFLCSNKVTLDHPYFNTEVGRREWENLPDDEKWADGRIKLSHESDHDGDKGIVQVVAKIDLPGKFDSFLRSEEERAIKFGK